MSQMCHSLFIFDVARTCTKEEIDKQQENSERDNTFDPLPQRASSSDDSYGGGRSIRMEKASNKNTMISNL